MIKKGESDMKKKKNMPENRYYYVMVLAYQTAIDALYLEGREDPDEQWALDELMRKLEKERDAL